MATACNCLQAPALSCCPEQVMVELPPTPPTPLYPPINFFYVHLHDSIRSELELLAALVRTLMVVMICQINAVGVSQSPLIHAMQFATTSRVTPDVPVGNLAEDAPLGELQERFKFLGQLNQYHSSVEDEVRGIGRGCPGFLGSSRGKRKASTIPPIARHEHHIRHAGGVPRPGLQGQKRHSCIQRGAPRRGGWVRGVGGEPVQVGRQGSGSGERADARTGAYPRHTPTPPEIPTAATVTTLFYPQHWHAGNAVRTARAAHPHSYGTVWDGAHRDCQAELVAQFLYCIPLATVERVLAWLKPTVPKGWRRPR
eukprot:1157884-Pelagomonas_calceolata.AAC.11